MYIIKNSTYYPHILIIALPHCYSRLMKDLSEALNGRGKTVDKLQVHLQELLTKLQVT